MATLDIKVPDIGDFADVAVIELMVKVGDTIKVDQSLLTVESDKASMEIPSSHAGVVTALLVKLGDKVKPTPEAVLEINSPAPLDGIIESYPITEVVAVCRAQLSEINFPEGASVVLVVRGRHVLSAKGHTVLLPGDHAYVFFRPEDREYIELLFGAPEAA